ncbi:MAG: DUF92 domain-containing protein [bacterium]
MIIDLLIILILMGFLSSIAILTELIVNKKLIYPEISREILHITAGITSIVAILFVQNILLLKWVSFFLVFLVFYFVYFSKLQDKDNNNSKSWGMFYFALSTFLLLFFLGDKYPDIIITSLLILTFSDSFAAIMGTFFAKSYFRITSDKKSIFGSAAFFILTFIILFFSPIYSSNFVFLARDVYLSFITAIAISVVLTSLEMISSNGLDNLTVPIFSGILLILLINPINSLNPHYFLFGLFLAFVISVISFRVKFLTLNGAAVTFLLAGFLFGLGSWKWSLPILTFFILSSVLSKIRKKKNTSVELYFEKSGTRDYLQVIANGGLGGILVILYNLFPNEIWYLIYVSSIAAVCADTWATEIGTYKKTSTFNILTLKRTEQGVSGGISWIGTFGALLGTIIISISGLFWIQNNLVDYIIIVVIAGMFGCFLDSFLGASIQAQYKCNVCGKNTERVMHCGKKTVLGNGYSWINNDFVNLFSGIAGGLVSLISIIILTN